MERLVVRRRAAAWTCIVCVVSVVAITILNLRDEVLRLLIQVLLLGASLLTGWYALTRCGLRRVVAAIISGVLLAVSLGGFFSGGRGSALSILSRIGLFVGAVSFGTFALGRENTAHFSTQRPGVAVPPAERGALFINPNSGGGKADQANLVDACRLRGIDTVTLNQGDDLSVLARNAIASGADVIGMAGGDGSLGLVADVASKGGVAMVVVPAGTRNHFALDLGLDRSDLIGALDAYGHAVESQVDVGMVGDRVFLNNVSLGLYALIVSSPNYRNAKVKTTLATLPTVLGPDTEPFDLQFSTPDGAIHPKNGRMSSKSPTILTGTNSEPLASGRNLIPDSSVLWRWSSTATVTSPGSLLRLLLVSRSYLRHSRPGLQRPSLSHRTCQLMWVWTVSRSL